MVIQEYMLNLTKGMTVKFEDIISTEDVWDQLATVMDPEIPVLSIIDLGIVRKVEIDQQNKLVKVTITPTYSGCPAMDVIRDNIRSTLEQKGIREVEIDTILSPAWTTDWMSEQAKQKLKAYGIAPPNPTQPVCSLEMFIHDEAVQCPRCNSFNTELISRFGSTACKSLYRCKDCQEPFDHFKCH